MIRLPATTRCITKAQHEAGACGLATDETCKTQTTNAGRRPKRFCFMFRGVKRKIMGTWQGETPAFQPYC
eukprot:3242305-Prymnesium_polylepis.1